MKHFKPVIGESGVINKPYRVEKAGHILLSNGDWMYIPKDYIFDNASIPNIFKWLNDLFGIEFFSYRHTAFLVHDYLYNFRGYRLKNTYNHRPVSRLFADKEMHYQMMMKFHPFKCDLFYFFVRLCGWLFWGKI